MNKQLSDGFDTVIERIPLNENEKIVDNLAKYIANCLLEIHFEIINKKGDFIDEGLGSL